MTDENSRYPVIFHYLPFPTRWNPQHASNSIQYQVLAKYSSHDAMSVMSSGGHNSDSEEESRLMSHLDGGLEGGAPGGAKDTAGSAPATT